MTILQNKNRHAFTIEELITHTNERLQSWYENALTEYGVEGAGTARYNGTDEFTIDYVEDGTKKTWSMCFYPEYCGEQNINWPFEVWQEQG